MIDHVGFAASDIAASRRFYEAALAPLRIGLIMTATPDQPKSGGPALGFGRDPNGANIQAVCHAPRVTRRVFTIGYEQTTIAELIAALACAGVKRVVDVRALPLSRRPGFSKTALARALAEAGIAYEHLKALGTPKEGRDAAKRGDRATLARVYAGQLELPEAQAAATILLDRIAAQPTAVLCYEREPADCHRTLLLTAIAGQAEVVDLFA